ncbi:NUDIX domain-containing protein [Thiolinea disciformis]|uniref:NUDIX domain-containing protein n=1 Tax=Thiolinea disciformis TaxID=125614 RepID=UPI0003A6E929|nr:NUDIX domain-containing protein [Thiolinea disciformis]
MKYCPQCQHPLEQRYIGELERTACSSPSCNFVHWDNPTPVVAAIVQQGDNFILGRNALWPAGLFSMITGFLEKNEAPEQAIRRETLEEIGLTVEEVHFLGHHILPQRNQLIIAYLVKTSGEVRLSDEIVEVKYLSRDALSAYDFGRFKLVAQIARQALALSSSASTLS